MKTQEIKRSNDFWNFVMVCVGIMLIGAAALYLSQLGVGIYLALSGTFMIVIAILLGKEHYLQDERSRKITEKAGYKAYIATIVTMLLLLAFGKTTPLIENANYYNIVVLIFLIGFVCFFVYSCYYSKKGDLE